MANKKVTGANKNKLKKYGESECQQHWRIA